MTLPPVRPNNSKINSSDPSNGKGDKINSTYNLLNSASLPTIDTNTKGRRARNYDINSKKEPKTTDEMRKLFQTTDITTERVNSDLNPGERQSFPFPDITKDIKQNLYKSTSPVPETSSRGSESPTSSFSTPRSNFSPLTLPADQDRFFFLASKKSRTKMITTIKEELNIILNSNQTEGITIDKLLAITNYIDEKLTTISDLISEKTVPDEIKNLRTEAQNFLLACNTAFLELTDFSLNDVIITLIEENVYSKDQFEDHFIFNNPALVFHEENQVNYNNETYNIVGKTHDQQGTKSYLLQNQSQNTPVEVKKGTPELKKLGRQYSNQGKSAPNHNTNINPGTFKRAKPVQDDTKIVLKTKITNFQELLTAIKESQFTGTELISYKTGKRNVAFVTEQGRPIPNIWNRLQTDKETTLHLLSSVLENVKDLHSKHIIHNDLKHDQVLSFGTSEDPTYSITDFGSSFTVDQSLNESSLNAEEIGGTYPPPYFNNRTTEPDTVKDIFDNSSIELKQYIDAWACLIMILRSIGINTYQEGVYRSPKALKLDVQASSISKKSKDMLLQALTFAYDQDGNILFEKGKDGLCFSKRIAASKTIAFLTQLLEQL